MGGILTSILAFVVAIGLLVAIHEFGHFWVARRLGIKVLRFSIGFGRAIWKRVGADGTEYVVAQIPLGGYVKMLDERDGPVPAAERDQAFNRKPVASRMAVLVAGPLANFLFAIAAYWLMFIIGVPGIRPLVGEVEPDSYAARAGLEMRDEIVAVGGRRTATWDTAMLALLDEMLDDGVIPVSVRRGAGAELDLVIDVQGEVESLTEPGALFPGLGISLWRLPAVLGELIEGGPAARAGLRPGDLVIAAAEEPIGSWSEWVQYVRAHPDSDLQIEIERNGRRMSIGLHTDTADEAGQAIGRIGAYPDAAQIELLRAEQRYGPIAALGTAVARTGEMATLTLRMFYRMLLGDVSIKNLSGPINIAQVAGQTASIGPVAFLRFLAIVSISLGLLNLFPIPMLDGGQLVYQLAELVKGSPVSERAELLGQQVGIAMLLVLMSFAFYNDIARLLG